MKVSCSLITLAVSALVSRVSMAEKQGNVFHPVLSWTGPIEEQDFENWSFMQSSVAL